MQRPHIAQLCALFELGDPIADLQPVEGGLLHKIWRLTTTKGSFAIKELNPALMQKPGIHESYQLSERIAAALAARGLPAVAALSTNDGALQNLAGVMVLVYPWIEGAVLGGEPVEAERARQIGSIVGRIHTTNLTFSELPQPEWQRFSADDWDMLTFHAADQGLFWAYPARALLFQLREWSHWYEQASAKLQHHLVVGHRDLDQKNVIWQDARTPWLIDWEAAGLINPTMEAVGVALSWNGLATGKVQEDGCKVLLESYRKAGGSLPDSGLDALHGVLGIWLGWLLFNMRRSLGESVSSESERLLGVRETTATLKLVRTLAEHSQTWAAWIDAYRS